jgi:hypothetical protein
VLVSPADAVALLQLLDVGTKLLDDTATLVAESHVGVRVVLICAAEARGCYFDKDLVFLEVVLSSLGFDDLAVLGTLVDCERGHCCGVSCVFKVLRCWFESFGVSL